MGNIFKSKKKVYNNPIRVNEFKSGIRLEIWFGDITDLSTDAIVNAANKYLKHGSGVAGSIVRKGRENHEDTQRKLSNEWIERYGYPETGGKPAYTKGSGELKCKFVIHAVGPICRDDEPTDEDFKLLKSCTLNCLRRCDELKMKSVGFPAISSGIFGFPKLLSTKTIIESIVEYLEEGDSCLELIILIAYDEPTVEAFITEFDKILKVETSEVK